MHGDQLAQHGIRGGEVCLCLLVGVWNHHSVSSSNVECDG